MKQEPQDNANLQIDGGLMNVASEITLNRLNTHGVDTEVFHDSVKMEFEAGTEEVTGWTVFIYQRNEVFWKLLMMCEWKKINKFDSEILKFIRLIFRKFECQHLTRLLNPEHI